MISSDCEYVDSKTHAWNSHKYLSEVIGDKSVDAVMIAIRSAIAPIGR